LQPVLDTLSYLKHETDVWFEITTLVIPGENDSDREFDELTSWVVEHLGPDGTIAMENGVRYAYTGNVHDEAGDSTHCHECGTVVIARDWYVLKEWNLSDDGSCAACGASCAGVFDGPPGTWGSRRLPVRLS
jgi:pyruvate formate lyase activating enzyme